MRASLPLLAFLLLEGKVKTVSQSQAQGQAACVLNIAILHIPLRRKMCVQDNPESFLSKIQKQNKLILKRIVVFDELEV